MARFIRGRLVFRQAAINDPELSEVTQLATEEASDCEGEVGCGGGDTPHKHLRITGREPEAGPRYYAVMRLGDDAVNGF